MTESRGVEAVRINRWPFVVADLLLILVALVTYAHGQHWPFGDRVGLEPWTGWVLTACVFLGAAFSVMPFLLEHRLWARMTEIDRVHTAVQQVRNIEQAARQIHSATASWQAVQDDASKAVAAARELQELMTAEIRSFQDFLQRANDNERTHLRLEVDKLRRSEGEWLQVLVRVLDQVWALYQAAVRSGKINLVEQLSHFQRACRDIAQRVGVVPFTAHNGEVLDTELHELASAEDQNRTNAPVAETVATGFRYQGQIVRKALVVLQPEEAAQPPAPPPVEEAAAPAPEPEPWPGSATAGLGDPEPESALEPATDPETERPAEWVEQAETERDPHRTEFESVEPHEPESAPAGGAADETPAAPEHEDSRPAAERPLEMDFWQNADSFDRPAPSAADEESDMRDDRNEPRGG